MLQRVAEWPSDDATIDRTAHRKLDPLLIPLDVRLQVWASWSSAPRDTWPPPVLEVDEAVQRLHWELCAALTAHYLNPDLGHAERAAAHGLLVRQHLASQVGPLAHQPRLSAGRGAYQQTLTIARWTLRHALHM
jgi:hypothetical protein